MVNQTTNNKMEKELTDLILSNEKNYNAYHTLLQNQNEITQQLVNESANIFIKQVVKVVAEKYSLEIEPLEKGVVKDNWGIDFTSENLLRKGLRIRIQFRKNLELPLVGYSVFDYKDKNEELKNLKEKFSGVFHNIEKEEHDWFIFLA